MIMETREKKGARLPLFEHTSKMVVLYKNHIVLIREEIRRVKALTSKITL